MHAFIQYTQIGMQISCRHTTLRQGGETKGKNANRVKSDDWGGGGGRIPSKVCSISVVQWFDSRADVMVIKIWALIYALLQAGRLGSCPRIYIFYIHTFGGSNKCLRAGGMGGMAGWRAAGAGGGRRGSCWARPCSACPLLLLVSAACLAWTLLTLLLTVGESPPPCGTLSCITLIRTEEETMAA